MKEVTSSYCAKDIESHIQCFWNESDTYRKVRDQGMEGPPFFFVDGPPYTTGHIHLGTAWNKIIKDSILRFHRMNGENVIDRAGYDMHGLPIEVRVEQKLGFVSKRDIEEFGIAPFIRECREFAEKNLEVMNNQFRELGIWLDFDDPYQTITPEYIEAAWWTLRKADEKKMLERGYRVVNWCPRCATAIADAEVEYWDERDPSVYVKFPVTGRTGEYLVIWTTTPWTLPANVAVAVHPDLEYAEVRARKDGREETLWIASDLVEQVLKKGRYQDYSIVSRRSGREMQEMSYSSPLARDVPLQETVNHRVCTADFVARENTGIVHIAPGHGWDDYLLGCSECLPVLCPVDSNGRFTADGGSFSGMNVREANNPILESLGGSLLAKEDVVHRYGHCWRCKTPIIFRATEQWFLKASDLRDTMLNEVARVTWYPEWAGSARFHDWIKEARDWCISRQRYWGIPIPIWQCPSCGAYRVIGTIRELEELSGEEVPDPHRPFVDMVRIPCTCGSSMHRVEDIFDVWFDSAVASWATLRFPRETDRFEKLWPASFITEGQDQTRGWFYSQLGASTIAFGCAPYRSVLMHGFALDAEGRKMSKSLGNVVSPREVIDALGVDILRLYVLSANAPWDDLKFNWEGVKTVHRTVNIFWNVYRFPLPYMSLDNFVPECENECWSGGYISREYSAMPCEDRFIISRVNSLTRTVRDAITTCQLHRATREFLSFVLEDLSRWYIQLVRPRMWLEEDAPEKRHAYETTYYVMRRLVALLAPFAPYLAEEVYQNLRQGADPESVHMLRWPGADEFLIDRTLEESMQVVRSFDEAQANARQGGKRKLRWPVRRCVVAASDPRTARAVRDLVMICRDRANSRCIEVVEGQWPELGWKAEPRMNALGPKFGRDAPRVRDLILAADAAALRSDLEGGKTVLLSTGGPQFEIDSSCVVFHESVPEGVYSAPMNGGTVYVDVTLDPDLEAEGYAREVIRRVQEMRRMMSLKVEDMVRATVRVGDPGVRAMIRGPWGQAIQGEVRASVISLPDGDVPEAGADGSLTREWEIEGIPIVISLSRDVKE